MALSVAGAGTAHAVDDVVSIPQDQTFAGVRQNYLAYIKTGNLEVDDLSAAGLYGLGHVLYERTNVENIYIEPQVQDGQIVNSVSSGQVLPLGVDPDKDDLRIFPFIYMAVAPDQPPLSKAAIDNLNRYMYRGNGVLFIDTRDHATNQYGRRWLKDMVDRGLDIPRLDKVKGCNERDAHTIRQMSMPDCHGAGMSYYLLDDFPGRYAEGDLWAAPVFGFSGDGISSVIIGGDEWTAAWAVDNSKAPVYKSIKPERREQAYRTGVNLVVYALTGNYKLDQLHIPAILERMQKDKRHMTPQP